MITTHTKGRTWAQASVSAILLELTYGHTRDIELPEACLHDLHGGLIAGETLQSVSGIRTHAAEEVSSASGQ